MRAARVRAGAPEVAEFLGSGWDVVAVSWSTGLCAHGLGGDSSRSLAPVYTATPAAHTVSHPRQLPEVVPATLWTRPAPLTAPCPLAVLLHCYPVVAFRADASEKQKPADISEGEADTADCFGLRYFHPKFSKVQSGRRENWDPDLLGDSWRASAFKIALSL